MATLQTTVVEHEQQLKDMEDRLAVVSIFHLQSVAYCAFSLTGFVSLMHMLMQS
jgi:hypothetical protein